VTSSPNPRHFGQYLKLIDNNMLWLPEWSFDEIKAVSFFRANTMKGRAPAWDDEMLRKRFAAFGGLPRYFFNNKLTIEERLAEVDPEIKA
jgi:hypothetical protein